MADGATGIRRDMLERSDRINKMIQEVLEEVVNENHTNINMLESIEREAQDVQKRVKDGLTTTRESTWFRLRLLGL